MAIDDLLLEIVCAGCTRVTRVDFQIKCGSNAHRDSLVLGAHVGTVAGGTRNYTVAAFGTCPECGAPHWALVEVRDARIFGFRLSNEAEGTSQRFDLGDLD